MQSAMEFVESWLQHYRNSSVIDLTNQVMTYLGNAKNGQESPRVLFNLVHNYESEFKLKEKSFGVSYL